MSSVSVSDTIPKDNKNQSLTVAKKSASNPKPPNQYEKNNNSNNKKKRKAHAVPLRRSVRLKKKREWPSRVLPGSNLVAQTGPSQYRGRVGGGRHIPSHSSGPAISNAPGPLVTAGTASVVQPSPSVSAQTPLPKPARVQPPVPLRKACCKICKVECYTPEILEQHKNGKNHQKNMRVHEELQTVSFTCALCDVKCESQVVYQSHLIGKEHLSRLTEVYKCDLCDLNFEGQLDVKPLPKPARVQPPVPPRKACCEICKVECDNPEILEQHKKGKKHQRNTRMHEELQTVRKELQTVHEELQTVSFTCALCDFKCNSQVTYQSHLTGKEHLSRLTEVYKCDLCDPKFEGELDVKPLPKPAQVQPPVPPRKACCEICKVECDNPEILEQHKKGKKHQRNTRMHEELQTVHEELQTVSFTCALCDFKCNSQVTYQRHLTGKIHFINLPESFTCELCDFKCESQVVYQSHLTGKEHLSRLTEVYKCQLCDLKFEGQVDYEKNLNGKRHLSRVMPALNHQASSGGGQQEAPSGGLLGLQAHYPPDINAQSNAINARVQQGDNNPQVLLAQLLMTVLSKIKTPVPATAPVTGATAAQIPAPTSMAGPSSEPQLLQTQVSEITAHVEMENPSGETKTELLPVQLGSNAQPGSSVSTRIEGGGSEAKQTGVKFPQDSSGVTPAANSGAANDQIPSECEAPTA